MFSSPAPTSLTAVATAVGVSACLLIGCATTSTVHPEQAQAGAVANATGRGEAASADAQSSREQHGECPPAATPADDAGDGPDMALHDAGLADANADLEPGYAQELLQREALEKCQAAAAFIAQDDIPAAIREIDAAYALLLEMDDNADDASLQAQADIRLLVAKLVNQAYGATAVAEPHALASWDAGLPLADNEHVRREIKVLTTVELSQFLAGYRRSGRYRPMILRKLEEAGLPSQLSWLPLVESWFKVLALSRASALGIWQFIASTGLRYGLHRDGWVDERRDPERSTDAAIAYLNDLHRLFGDWPKALAAYNCGEGRVGRLQRAAADKSQYVDFWDLHAQLPRETRRYFPRLIAALQIIENPERYGVTLPEVDSPPEPNALIDVARPVKLDALASALKLEPDRLVQLNPELRHRATPDRPYQLRVPAQQREEALTLVETLPEWKPPKPQYIVHRVRSGQTLSTIAARYHASVAAIMRLNRIRNPHRIWAGQRIRIPVRR